MRVVGYLRVSGKGQVEGDGFYRQHQAIEEFCRVHFPDAQVIYAREEGVSGSVDADERPMLASMLASWDKGDSPKPDAIVVEKMDRLARDLMVQECAVRDFKAHNIKLYSTDHGLVDMVGDISDPSRVMIRQVFGAIAQYDKTVTVLRLRASRRRKKERDGKCEGRKFFGEKNLHDRWVVGRILSLFDCGLKSRMISRTLAEQGVRNSSGRACNDRLIRRVIARHRPDVIKHKTSLSI